MQELPLLDAIREVSRAARRWRDTASGQYAASVDFFFDCPVLGGKEDVMAKERQVARLELGEHTGTAFWRTGRGIEERERYAEGIRIEVTEEWVRLHLASGETVRLRRSGGAANESAQIYVGMTVEQALREKAANYCGQMLGVWEPIPPEEEVEGGAMEETGHQGSRRGGHRKPDGLEEREAHPGLRLARRPGPAKDRRGQGSAGTGAQGQGAGGGQEDRNGRMAELRRPVAHSR